MTNNRRKKFILFLIGAIISIVFSIAAFMEILFNVERISWELVTFAITLCVLPVLFLGFPYLNSLFDLSYSKNSGIKIVEEKRIKKPKNRVLFAIFLALFFVGCAEPKIIKEAVYINRDCARAADFAPAVWLPVRWVSIEIVTQSETLENRRSDGGGARSSSSEGALLRREAAGLCPDALSCQSAVIYACTSDREALLGNLERLK